VVAAAVLGKKMTSNLKLNYYRCVLNPSQREIAQLDSPSNRLNSRPDKLMRASFARARNAAHGHQQ
jgi:hypothetical protein